jgi:hypothetical protein
VATRCLDTLAARDGAMRRYVSRKHPLELDVETHQRVHAATPSAGCRDTRIGAPARRGDTGRCLHKTWILRRIVAGCQPARARAEPPADNAAVRQIMVTLAFSCPYCPNNGRTILCGTIVVAENPTDSLTASNRPNCRPRRRAVDQRIADPLVIALGMIVRDVLTNQPTEVPLAKREHPIQAFLFDRSHEAFCIRVAVRRGRRRPHHANADRAEHDLHRRGPIRIPIAQQDTALTQDRIALTEETAHGLPTKAPSGCGVEPSTQTRRECSSMTNAV